MFQASIDPANSTLESACLNVHSVDASHDSRMGWRGLSSTQRHFPSVCVAQTLAENGYDAQKMFAGLFVLRAASTMLE